MDLQNAEAIVLDLYDLHDYDRIVTFLTRCQGKKRGVARGARRKHSRFAGQLQPLSTIGVSWLEKDGRDLVRISGVELIRAPTGLQRDLEGMLLSAYLRDHMLEFAQEHESEDHLFRLLDSTISALDEGVDRNLATRYFEAWILRLAGVFPAPVCCPVCGSELRQVGAVLPAQSEGLVCLGCSDVGGLVVEPPVLEFLLRISRGSLNEIAQDPPEQETLVQLDRLCSRVRRSFLQHELKSYDVIRETLQSLG